MDPISDKFIPCKANEWIYYPTIIFIEDSFYVIGGYIDGMFSDTIGRLNAQTRKWSRAGQLITRRDQHGTIFDGSSLLVVGGIGLRRNLKTETCKISNGQVSCEEQEVKAEFF